MPETLSPSSITVRMYNVGFGDCFLLTFHYAAGQRHMLVDFGSAASPRSGTADYMQRVARDIVRQCGGKLHIVVSTHRHRDHISGFSTEQGGTGKMIADLHPDHVILPWTEDPEAAPDASAPTTSSYTRGKPDPKVMKTWFLRSLADMHEVAASVASLSLNPGLAGRDTRTQLQFLGEDNLKNLSAIQNLRAMGDAARAYYVNAGMILNSLLPGVKITVLGPPTLEQSNAIRKRRATDPGEFWQFCNFWASRHTTAKTRGGEQQPIAELPPNVRWFIRQSRQILADQMLELVRDLDNVLNNTSVILLLEAGSQKLLLPGDAQIENWAFALKNPEWRKLLAAVNLYKVGHHGSLNATPKSLWRLFRNKGDESRRERLHSMCSTRSGKHGNFRSGTEVPRRTLVEELRAHSSYTSTDESRTLCHKIEIPL